MAVATARYVLLCFMPAISFVAVGSTQLVHLRAGTAEHHASAAVARVMLESEGELHTSQHTAEQAGQMQPACCRQHTLGQF